MDSHETDPKHQATAVPPHLRLPLLEVVKKVGVPTGESFDRVVDFLDDEHRSEATEDELLADAEEVTDEEYLRED